MIPACSPSKRSVIRSVEQLWAKYDSESAWASCSIKKDGMPQFLGALVQAASESGRLRPAVALRLRLPGCYQSGSNAAKAWCGS